MATNVVASRPAERRPTGTPTARANNLIWALCTPPHAVWVLDIKKLMKSHLPTKVEVEDELGNNLSNLSNIS